MKKKQLIKLGITLSIVGSIYFISSYKISVDKLQILEQANNLFDPKMKTIKGSYTPSIFGGPSISGTLNNNEAERLKNMNSKHMEMGAIIKGDLKLIIYLSDNRFRITKKE